MQNRPVRSFILLLSLSLLGAVPAAFSASNHWHKLRPSLSAKYRLSRPSQRLRYASSVQSEALSVSVGDTIHVLAIRVEFQPDTIDQTTGTGRFVYTPNPEITIDPPPHDRAYFEAQLTALANYFNNVSRGKLILDFDVYPREPRQAYGLERTMDYYGPGRDSPESDSRLTELFRDGFAKADQSDNIDFSSYDSFILFHAGVGEDFDEDFDPSPNDIPSAFLTTDDLRDGLAGGDPGFSGVAVQNGTFFIPDGLVLPETQSREVAGSGLLEFGLLGTAAIMFGHQIGLPSLFDTESGASGIGYWGLMDQGSNNFQGLMPAQPCAWSKVFLGWEEPIVVTHGENLPVAAALAAHPNKIYKIPITDGEYFLIENRIRDRNGDRITIGRDINGTRIEFKASAAETGFLAADTIGVITWVEEYDFGLPFAVDDNGRALPGAGILIWHIDETVIRENYASNRVNADRDHRGVDLEEADGAQDIGRFYDFFDPGFGSELGLPEDAWWASNPVIVKYLRPDEPVRFGPETIPSTASNSGVFTGIVFTDFSEVKPVMTVSVRNELALPGFPQFASGKTNALPPMLADLTQWMVHWASTPEATWALFWLAVAESSFFPLPVDVLLIAMGLITPAAGIRYGVIATVGSVAGAVVGYWIGQWGGRPLLERWVSGERIGRVEATFRRYEAWAIAVAGFTPIPYKVFTIAAGIFRATLWKFIAVSFLSRGARFVGEGLLFYFFGEPIAAFIRRDFNTISVVIVVLLAVGAYAIHRRSRAA